jgi:hypothetical protein
MATRTSVSLSCLLTSFVLFEISRRWVGGPGVGFGWSANLDVRLQLTHGKVAMEAASQ